MRVAVVGLGAVGARVARQLLAGDEVERLHVADLDDVRARALAESLGPRARRSALPTPDGDLRAAVDVVVLASPPGSHAPAAAAAVAAGRHVVSVSDEVDDVRDLLELDDEARRAGRVVAVGAGFAPGLTDVLAAHAATGFDVVDEVHVAKHGTAGPACARQHHRALRGTAIDWRDGAWHERRGGTGRELCWFPDPVGAQDCYRAALPDALLLGRALPGAERITARVSATRRDRLTTPLPMLRKPHPEGTLGAVRVEVRGRRGPGRDATVLGALDRPGVAAGTVAALTALAVVRGDAVRSGAAGLGELLEPVPLLTELARRGVRCAVFEGALSAPPVAGPA